MSYTVLAVLGVVVAIGCDRWLLRTRLLTTRTFWVAYAIILAFQLVANGVLTGLQIVRYNPDTILGTRIVYAPVEDLAFGFALITITLSCWVWCGSRWGDSLPAADLVADDDAADLR